MKRAIAFVSIALSAGTFAQQPMTLRQCIEYATAHNVTIKKSANAAEQQKVELSTARNSRLPDLSAGMSEQINFGRGLNNENSYVNRNTQSTNLSLSTSVPIFTGMRIPNEIAARKLSLEASVADLEHARQNISLQVTSAYLQAVYTREVINAEVNQVALSKIQEDRLNKLLNAGKVSETDVSEARTQVAQDELAQTQAEADYRLALLDLSQILELSTPEGLSVIVPENDVPETLPPSPDAIFACAVNEKPEIKAEKLRLQAEERNIDIAKAAYYPTLSFGAGLSSNYYKTSGIKASSFGKQLNENFQQYLGLTLNIPLFNRFATRNSVKQAQLQHEAQNLVLDETKKSLYKEIQQAYYNTINAEAKYRSSLVAEKTAEQNFVLVTRKYETGKANATEFAEAKTKQINATITRLQAKYEYIFRMKIIKFYQGEEIS